MVNLVYDNVINDIFIGGENVLLKVSVSLVEFKKDVIGFKLDYIDCIEKVCFVKVVNNRNKLLLIDNKKRRLIICDSF